MAMTEKQNRGGMQPQMLELPPVGEPLRPRALPPLPPDGMKSGGGSGWRWAVGCGVLALVMLCGVMWIPYAIGRWVNHTTIPSASGLKSLQQQVLPELTATGVNATVTPGKTATPDASTPTPAPSPTITATLTPPSYTVEQLSRFVIDVDSVTKKLPGDTWTPNIYMETDANQWSADAGFVAQLSTWNYLGSLFSSYDQMGGGNCAASFCSVVSVAMLFQTAQDAQAAYAAFVASTTNSLTLVDPLDLPKHTPNYTEECMWGASGFGFFFTCSGVTGNMVFNLSLYTAATPNFDLQYLGIQTYQSEYHTSPGLKAF